MALSDALGTHRRNLNAAAETHVKLLTGDLLYAKREIPSRQVSRELRDAIDASWKAEENTRVSPKASDNIRVKTADGSIVFLPRYLLETTQEEVYKNFVRANPQFKVDLRTFEKFKPFNVRTMRACDKITCGCTYHETVRLDLHSLAIARRVIHKNSPCLENAPCKRAIPSSPSAFIEKCVCTRAAGCEHFRLK